MESIRGRKSLGLDFDGLMVQITGSDRIHLDLGTGDGRYVHTLAEKNPGWFVIGVDTCRENLRDHSRAKLQNVLFLIADAQELPCELKGLVAQVTINFPWGSLLEGLLTCNSRLYAGLAALSRSITSFDIRLNGGALAQAGWTLEPGVERIRTNMIGMGWHVNTPVMMDACALQAFPSTWAKRLAFGRDGRTIELSGWFSSP